MHGEISWELGASSGGAGTSPVFRRWHLYFHRHLILLVMDGTELLIFITKLVKVLVQLHGLAAVILLLSHLFWCRIIAEPVLGCTDSSAENFNAEADTDDGSCTWNGGCALPSYSACDNGVCIPTSYGSVMVG